MSTVNSGTFHNNICQQEGYPSRQNISWQRNMRGDNQNKNKVCMGLRAYVYIPWSLDIFIFMCSKDMGESNIVYF